MAVKPAPERLKRKRKAHKKSRQGCKNCKLRRVKVRQDETSTQGFTLTDLACRGQCDEAKPACKRCLEFGVECNYGPCYDETSSELQVPGGSVFQLTPPPRSPSQADAVLGLMNGSLGQTVSVLQMGHDDLGLLDRFYTRTILTLGTPDIRLIYQGEAVRLASLVCTALTLPYYCQTLTPAMPALPPASFPPCTSKPCTHSSSKYWCY